MEKRIKTILIQIFFNQVFVLFFYYNINTENIRVLKRFNLSQLVYIREEDPDDNGEANQK